MEISVNLGTWTYDTVLDIVRHHEFEPGVFDFKEVLKPTKGDKSDENAVFSLRKTVCSMANGDGGFIIIGVKDRKVLHATPDELVVGIPLGGDLRSEFGQKLSDI